MSTWQLDLLGIVFNSKFMSLATASTDGQPWVSPLVYGCDEQLRFYWASAHEARHSVNVSANPRAALAIYDSRQMPNIKIQGFYAEGAVEELAEADLDAATRIFYGWRYPLMHVFAEKLRGPKHFLGDSARRLYRLTPSQTYGLDPAGHPIWGTKIDMRVDVSILPTFAERYRQEFGHLFK
jgi:uncharacterized protein YhbP (UPF0306 family)